MTKKLSALSFRLSAYCARHTSLVTFAVLAACCLLLADTAWAQPSAAGTAATQQVTDVACGVITLIDGIVGKMLAFIFLAAGAVSAFVGKWAYVVGGVGGGILLIAGPQILKAAFTTAATCS